LAVRIAVAVLWGVLGLYWLVAAAWAKHGTQRGRNVRPGLIAIISVVLVLVFRETRPTVHAQALQEIGLVVLVAGLGLAVWARINLGRNWGMPMTQTDEPELVTSGPYRSIRHPIYSGLLLGLLATALATNPYWFIALGIMAAYFIHSAQVEEGLMTASFPAAYPSYKARTKMLVPFLL
jgi:protein-S-isoprenylcysteine O-methyltransferase Ste14